MCYSWINYPVGHTHAGTPVYQKDMTVAEYQDLIHRYEELHKKTNSRSFFYWDFERTQEQKKNRLNKERDQKRKIRGLWQNSENDLYPGKGTETIEQREVRRIKDRNRAAKWYKNLSEEQKKNRSRAISLRQKISQLGRIFSKEEWDELELYCEGKYCRPRVNCLKGTTACTRDDAIG
jgi:hypothetical protein